MNAAMENAKRAFGVIIFGLLVTRALRSRNIREIRIGGNLLECAEGYVVRFAVEEMKGHRPFESSVPDEL